GSAVATFTTSSLAVGSHTITATYNSDANFNGSTSSSTTETVAAASTTTALGNTPTPSVFGQATTLTATVAPVAPGTGTPTGTVDFFDGETLLATATVISGQAVISTSAFAVGSHSITAVYSGDAGFNGATSAVSTETVNQAGTTTGLA